MPDEPSAIPHDKFTRSEDAVSPLETRRLVQEAEPFLRLDSDTGAKAAVASELPTEQQAAAEPFRFEEFSKHSRLTASHVNADNVPISLSIQLGGTHLDSAARVELAPGSTVTLNELANEPVEIIKDGSVVALGEVVTVSGRPGIRILEIL